VKRFLRRKEKSASYSLPREGSLIPLHPMF